MFTHSPSPPVENEEIDIDDKGNAESEIGKSEEKEEDKDVDEKEEEREKVEEMDEEEKEKVKVVIENNKLERRASIHYVSRSVRLRQGEKLFAEVSSSSSPSVLTSPMSGSLLSDLSYTHHSFRSNVILSLPSAQEEVEGER